MSYTLLVLDAGGWSEYRRWKTEARTLNEARKIWTRMQDGYYPQLKGVRVVEVVELYGKTVFEEER